MNKIAIWLFIFNIAYSTTLWQRLKRCPVTESNNSSMETPKYNHTVHLFNFSQRLDHLNVSNDQRWNQRYAVVVDYYKKAGPAFLHVNGANSMDIGFEFPDNVLAYAKHLNAICFSLEHRFYSRAQPINASMLKYLSIAQALEDIANFITGVAREFHLPKKISFIVFGCSYGGFLAALARRNYPHLIHGSISSSGPLQAQVDYYEYEQIVEESLKHYNSNCVESITLGFEEIAHLANSTSNEINVPQFFHLEFPLPKKSAILDLLKTLQEIINRAVQSNDLRVNPIPIPILCRTMVEYNGTKMEAFAEIIKMVRNYSEGNEKIPSEISQKSQHFVEDEIVFYLTDEQDDAWLYQRCSEFGYFSSCTNTTFLLPVKHLLSTIEHDIKSTCRQFFGPNFKNLTEKIDRTNSQYGGLNFNTSNTLFIYGSYDPWYKLGLYQKSNASLYETIFITGIWHCADLLPPTDDMPELKNIRNKVLQTLKNWLRKSPL